MNNEITNNATAGAEAQEVKNPSKEEVIIQPGKKNVSKRNQRI